MRSKYAEFTRIELPRLTHQLTQDLVAHRLRGFQFAAPFTHRTRLAQHVRQRFTRALACHFDQTQLCKPVDRHAGTIARQRFAELVEHGVAMLFAIHVDKIDDNDAAQIAQSQLARDDLRRFKIGFEYGVVKTAHADKTAGVHIHRGQRFGLVDDQIPARFKTYPPCQRLLDFSLNTVKIKQRPLTLIAVDALGAGGRVVARELLHGAMNFGGIHHDGGRFVAHEIAQHAQPQIEVLIQQHLRRGGLRTFLDACPNLAQIGKIGGELGLGGHLGHGADDVAALFAGRQQTLQLFTQLRTIFVVFNTLRNANIGIILRQIHQKTPGDADLRGQPRALGAQRVFHHLHHQVLTFG